MRRHYGEQRKTFIITFALYQCSTWATAGAVGTLGWNLISLVRAAILLLLLFSLLFNTRRLDWAVVLVIFVILTFRLTTQALR